MTTTSRAVCPNRISMQVCLLRRKVGVMASHTFPDGTRYTLTNIFPPIPDRRFDWCAQLDDNETMQGFGATENEAIMDLLRLMEECAEANSCLSKEDIRG